MDNQEPRVTAGIDLDDEYEAPKVCIHPLATRPVLYTDTVGGVQTCRDDLWAVTTEELNYLHNTIKQYKIIDEIRVARLERLEEQQNSFRPDFLLNGTRFKLNFSARGNVDVFHNYAAELQGRWVALVPAEDDVHLTRQAAPVAPTVDLVDYNRIVKADEKALRAVDALDGMGFTYDAEIGWLPPAATTASSSTIKTWVDRVAWGADGCAPVQLQRVAMDSEIADLRAELARLCRAQRTGKDNNENIAAQAAHAGAEDIWQPIETAPHDVVLLLAYEFDRPGDWRIKVGGFWNGEWEVFGASWTPTRWMPLPGAPTVSDYKARRAAIAASAKGEMK